MLLKFFFIIFLNTCFKFIYILLYFTYIHFNFSHILSLRYRINNKSLTTCSIFIIVCFLKLTPFRFSGRKNIKTRSYVSITQILFMIYSRFYHIDLIIFLSQYLISRCYFLFFYTIFLCSNLHLYNVFARFFSYQLSFVKRHVISEEEKFMNADYENRYERNLFKNVDLLKAWNPSAIKKKKPLRDCIFLCNLIYKVHSFDV